MLMVKPLDINWQLVVNMLNVKSDGGSGDD